jgi:hypothetical protein
MENRMGGLRKSLAKGEWEDSIAFTLDHGLVKPKTATELI